MPAYTLLAIETSCDETGACVYHTQRGVLSNALFSQVALHAQFGGVVPEIASRSHLEKIAPIVQSALETAGCTLSDVDVFAVTTKPGLPGSLLVGISFTKTLALCFQKPLIGVDHIEAHIFSPFIQHQVPFSHLCLLASGGNTALFIVHDFGRYELVATTLDDAAGEAFDKVAKLIGLPYPGGPVIEQYAARAGFEDFFSYPRGSQHMKDFSFSGIKTAVLYDLIKRGAYDGATKKFLKPNDDDFKARIASSLLVCIGDVLADKITKTLKAHPEIRALTFVGGVAGNQYLRRRFEQLCQHRGLEFFVPAMAYCADNAAMVAFVAGYKAARGQFDDYTLDFG